MPESIPTYMLDLFERPVVAQIATVQADGTPHLVPIWVDYDGEVLLFTTPGTTRKDEHLKHQPACAICLLDPGNPARYLSVQGRVVRSTREGARQHVDRMAHKYKGEETYTGEGSGPTRTLYQVKPEHVIAHSL